MRIIAGEKKGFALRAPAGLATRPTLGRVRESIFMRLHDRLPGARVLDLFAGAGSLGFEALSRGAAHAVFVEDSPPAVVALRENLARLGWAARASIVPRDALRWLRDPAASREPFDFILLDPPYHQDLAAATLSILGERAAQLLEPGSTVIAQVGRKDVLDSRYGPLRLVREKSYGDTRVLEFQLADSADSDEV